MRLLIIAITLAVTLRVTATPCSAQSREERGKALWAEGAARYDAGKFEDAATLFVQAYELWPEPEILFNLCQAHRQLRHYERAIFFCKSYLRNKPAADNRDDVEYLIIEMDRLAEAQRDSDSTPPQGVERPDGAPSTGNDLSPWYADRWGWGVGGAGVLVMAVGGAGLLWATSLDDDARATIDAGEASRLAAQAGDMRTFGVVTTLVGAAALTAGVVMLAWNPPGSRKSPTLSAGFGWIEIRGSF